jgi:hypothetical protein
VAASTAVFTSAATTAATAAITTITVTTAAAVAAAVTTVTATAVTAAAILTTAAVATAAAAVTTTAAAVTTTAAATATATTVATAAGSKFRTLARFIDAQGATGEFRAIQAAQGLVRSLLSYVSDKGKTTGAPSHLIHCPEEILNLSKRHKQLAHLILSGAEAHIPHV